LIIPKRHVGSFFDLEADERAELLGLLAGPIKLAVILLTSITQVEVILPRFNSDKYGIFPIFSAPLIGNRIGKMS